MDALTAMAEGLSVVEECVVFGVAPLDAGMCIETAAGVRRTI